MEDAPTTPAPGGRKCDPDVLEEVVQVADYDAEDVRDERLAHEGGEAKEDPGQVRGAELEDAEEVHARVRVATSPDVDHHEAECRPEEEHVDERSDHLRRGEGGQRATNGQGSGVAGNAGRVYAGALRRTMSSTAPKRRKKRKSAGRLWKDPPSSMLQ